MSMVAVLILGVYVVSWFGAAWSGWLFTSRMKRRHSQVWERVNAPAAQNQIQRSWKVVRWKLRREYATLGDPDLTELGDWSNRLGKVFLAVFVAVFVLFFAHLWP